MKPVLHNGKLERPVHDPDPAAVFQVDPTVKQYTPEETKDIDIEPLHTEMIVIEGGSFTRGSNQGNRDEMPRHEISVGGFAIDIHPVTNEQYVRFLEVMEGVKDSNHNDLINLKESRIKRSADSSHQNRVTLNIQW